MVTRKVDRKNLFTFRFTGRFDWKHIYRECKDFWLHLASTDHDLVETLYKHKPSKLEVRWDVYQNYDAYYQITYHVWFKIILSKMVYVDEDGERKEYMEGAVRVWTWYGWNENYPLHSFAGESSVFKAEWLRAIYRKITWRERWDLVDDIGMFTVNDFTQLLGKLYGTESSGYASIWEPG